MILQLPTEVLHYILHLVPRATIAQLCLTCQWGHALCLPVLYAHLELGLRSHIRQLEGGLRKRALLRQTLHQYTKKLTLISQQNGSQWLMADLQDLLQRIPNLRTLIFRDFHMLSVETMCAMAPLLLHVERVDFRYCNLVIDAKRQRASPSPAPLGHSTEILSRPDPLHNQHSPSHEPPSNHPAHGAIIPSHPSTSPNVFQNTTSLLFFWTDFSEPAMDKLLSLFPNLSQVNFGANHNRILTANDSALRILCERCSHINDLSVSLQQVSEATLCHAIETYGPQLRSLSIRCDSSQTLHAVATHATCITSLSVRAIANPSNMSSLQGDRRSPGGATIESEDLPTVDSMVDILQHCQNLSHLEMICWMIEDIPREIWCAMETVAARRRRRTIESNVTHHNSTNHTSRVHALKSMLLDTKHDTLSQSATSSPQMSLTPPASNTPDDHRADVRLSSFDDQSARGRESAQPRRLGRIKKTLSLDPEELCEIRRQIIPTSIPVTQH